MSALAEAPQASAVPVLGADEAISVASTLAQRFAEDSKERDAERVVPREQMDELAASGLLAITVPREFGGAELPPSVVAQVFAKIAEGDPNVAQLPHSHFVYVGNVLRQATPEQQRFLLTEVLHGKRFGNAQSEVGTKHIREFRTTLTPAAQGGWVLNGTKGYCTGALLADWIPVLAHQDVDGPMVVAWVERDAPGVEVIDDWNGMGQRTTASGTVKLTDVAVPADLITGYTETFTGPQTHGSIAQLLHSAIDVGIARAAINEAAAFVTSKSRPYPDAGVDRAADDPLIVHAMGEMEVSVRAAEALLVAAGVAVDAAEADLNEESAGLASLAVAASRVSSTQASVEVSSRLFEVAGTRSALDSLNLNRHWRNARTHTLHDPAAWKVQHLGRHILDGVFPPSHGQI